MASTSEGSLLDNLSPTACYSRSQRMHSPAAPCVTACPWPVAPHHINTIPHRLLPTSASWSCSGTDVVCGSGLRALGACRAVAWNCLGLLVVLGAWLLPVCGLVDHTAAHGLAGRVKAQGLLQQVALSPAAGHDLRYCCWRSEGTHTQHARWTSKDGFAAQLWFKQAAAVEECRTCVQRFCRR